MTLALLLLAAFDTNSAGACFVYGHTAHRPFLVAAAIEKARAAHEGTRTVLAGRLFLERIGQLAPAGRERSMQNRGRAACTAIGVD